MFNNERLSDELLLYTPTELNIVGTCFLTKRCYGLIYKYLYIDIKILKIRIPNQYLINYVDPFDDKTQTGHPCDVLDRSTPRYDFLDCNLRYGHIVQRKHLHIYNCGKPLNLDSLD